MHPDEIVNYIAAIPTGYSEVMYNGKKYGMSRTDFAGGKSTKVYAEERGGNDYISFNYYRTQKGGLLKTCEMPEEKVLTFLEDLIIHQPK
jgi:peptide-methionine (S)-S-oxide reductase